MKILFIHKNFPAQFGHLARWLAEHGWDVTFATSRKDARSQHMRIIHFEDHRQPSDKTHHYLIGTERAVIAGQGFVRAAMRLNSDGYKPDVVVAHSGWGVGFFVKDLWPKTAYIQYAEWYYSYPHADQTRFGQPLDPMEESARCRVRNAPFWLDFSAADATICPTPYQASRFPEKIQSDITILNDGFDTRLHCPAPPDRHFLEAHGIPPGAELLTYVARGMEPARGFPDVMSAIEQLQKRRSNLHAVIIAEDRVAYGPKIRGLSWKDRMINDLDLDLSRVHFTGLLPRAGMIKFLQASQAHLYLSAPFVLSWSMIEAMSCGAPIVAARSAPVEDVMQDCQSGLLVTPEKTEDVCTAVEQLLDAPHLAKRLGQTARQKVVDTFDAETLIFPKAAQFFSAMAHQVTQKAETSDDRKRPRLA